jgi:hypothetical protein
MKTGLAFLAGIVIALFFFWSRVPSKDEGHEAASDASSIMAESKVQTSAKPPGLSTREDAKPAAPAREDLEHFVPIFSEKALGGILSLSDATEIARSKGIVMKPVDDPRPPKYLKIAERQELVDGILTAYYESGIIAEQGEWDGAQQGIWVSWDRGGAKVMQGSYVNGLAEGLWEVYYPSGQLRCQGTCRAGKRDGRFTYWNEDGAIDESRSGVYRDDLLIR